MRWSVSRFLLGSALVLFASNASSAIHLTPPIELTEGAPSGPDFNYLSPITGARVQGGFVALWASQNVVEMALLDESGARKHLMHLPLRGVQGGAFPNASDGIDALVALPVYQSSEDGMGHVLLRIRPDGSFTTLPWRRQEVLSLFWNGTSYIAITVDRVIELDREGDVLAETSLTHLGTSFRWDAIVFVDGPRVWAVKVIEGTILRAALTNEAGHVISPQWVTFPFAIPQYWPLYAAGRDRAGMFLIHGAYNDMILQFVDRNGSSSGEPIPLKGFVGGLRTERMSDGALLIVDRNGRVARVKRDEARLHHRDAPSEFSETVTVTTAILRELEQSHATLFATSDGGAVCIGMLESDDGRNDRWYAPVAVHLRTGRDVLAITHTEPITLARPSVRSAAAAPHGDGFLVVWQQVGLVDSEVWMRFVDALGVPRGTATFLGRGVLPQIASRGDLALVVWWRNERNAASVEAVRIGLDARPIDADPATLTSAFEYPVPIHVTFDAMQFNVFVQTYDGLRTAVVPAVTEGAIPPPSLGTIASSQFRAEFIVGAPGNTLLLRNVWPTIHAWTLRHDLSPRDAPRPISVLGAQRMSALWDGEHFVVVWRHNDHFRFGRVSASGEPIDSEYGQVLGNLPIPEFVNRFAVMPRGDRYLIATGSQIAILEPASPSKGIKHGGDHLEAFASRADGTVLLVTSVPERYERGFKSRFDLRTVLP